MKPLRSLLLAAVLLVGVTIGLGIAGRLEPFFEPILVYFSPEPQKLWLEPVDYNPFPDELNV